MKELIKEKLLAFLELVANGLAILFAIIVLIALMLQIASVGFRIDGIIGTSITITGYTLVLSTVFGIIKVITTAIKLEVEKQYTNEHINQLTHLYEDLINVKPGDDSYGKK